MSIGNKVKSSYTLSNATNARIDHLASSWDVSKTRVIEELVSIAPKLNPGKKVTVLSLDPLVCTTNGWEWEEKYTGDLYLEFQPVCPVRQMIITVESMSFEEITEWVISFYEGVMKLLPSR